MSSPKSKNALVGKIIKLRQGLHIYRVGGSPFYRVRIWIPSQKRRIVRSTKCDNRIEAISAAEEYYSSLGTKNLLQTVQNERTFAHYADRLIKLELARGERGECSNRLWKTTKFYLRHKSFGSEKYFSDRDVGTITEKEYRVFFSKVQADNPTLKAVTLNQITSTFNKVLGLAYQDGIIERKITGARVKPQTTARTFFRFHPIVDKEHDEWKKLLKCAKDISKEKIVLYRHVITLELYDLILFLCHSFCRPTVSELYALKFSDISILDNPKTLLVNYRRGKTGKRQSPTTEFCVAIFQRIRDRYKDATHEDYIFLPSVTDREKAKRIFQAQFRHLLEKSDLLTCKVTNKERSLYSIRHTSLQMRFVKSRGTVSSRILARAAGTSEKMLDAHYLNENLITKDLIENLQSFGHDEED